ncbi:hypothetical protein GCM10010984_12830 [Chishuiella changwenlii]|nr:hypothetical protein GCM10010984_12830 [Chishuiella changwenlii]
MYNQNINYMKKKLILLLTTLSFLYSCKNDDEFNKENSDVKNYGKNLSQKDELKQEFSKALAKALANNVELRKFIKEEALKMFDNDYDILYQIVKDEKIGDSSFRDIVLEYYDKKENLNILEQYYPTLTIFVPELPLNTFSAKKWNAENEIPLVAYTLIGVYDIPIVDSTGEITFLKGEYIPSFPVVVVKENERVRVDNTHSLKSINSLNTDSYNFEFLDESFNGALSSKKNTSSRSARIIDDKLISAYQIYQNNDGWQRDYIYYDITPSQNRGQFKYNYMEHLTSFRLNNAEVLNKISDQTGDPVLNRLLDPGGKGVGSLPRAPWTGGNFEFKIDILLNAKNGIGTSITKYLSVRPEELYSTNYALHYTYVGRIRIPVIQVLTSLTPKVVPLDIQLFNWDLNEYASSIKIQIEEVDLTEEESRSDTRTVEFATNFGIDPSVGFLKKIGLKFGASLKTVNTRVVNYKVTKQSDPLGDVIINFADNFLTNIPGTRERYGMYNPREYDSGDYTITVQPKRVQ